jgi:hypothetical protein
MNRLEIYGYFCSLVVVIGFLMPDMDTMRIVNCIGCVMFAVYGYYKKAIPIVAINVIVTIIHLYFLLK